MSKDPHIQSPETQQTSKTETIESPKFKEIRNLIYSGQLQTADHQIELIASHPSLTAKDRIEIKLIKTKLLLESREIKKSLELIAEVNKLIKTDGSKLQEIDANIWLAKIHLAQNSCDEALDIQCR